MTGGTCTRQNSNPGIDPRVHWFFSKPIYDGPTVDVRRRHRDSVCPSSDLAVWLTLRQRKGRRHRGETAGKRLLTPAGSLWPVEVEDPSKPGQTESDAGRGLDCISQSYQGKHNTGNCIGQLCVLKGALFHPPKGTTGFAIGGRDRFERLLPASESAGLSSFSCSSRSLYRRFPAQIHRTHK